jgi:hypothetical protein
MTFKNIPVKMGHLKKIIESSDGFKKLNKKTFDDFDISEVINLLIILQDDNVSYSCKLGHMSEDGSLITSGSALIDINKNKLPDPTDGCSTPIIHIRISPYENLKLPKLMRVYFSEVSNRHSAISEFIDRVSEIYNIGYPNIGYRFYKENKTVYQFVIVSKK